jgi:hypothetical protein
VTRFHYEKDGTVHLIVRLVLARGNLPSFLKWNRLSDAAIFQTNLQVTVPATWAVSTFRILPLPLHSLAGDIPANRHQFGTAFAAPIERDVFVAGDISFALGDFQVDEGPAGCSAGETSARSKGHSTENEWSKSRKNERFKAFALLNDYCARGGAITDADFLPHYAAWKMGYLELTRLHLGGRHLPKASLSRVAPFPATAALQTIYNNARLLDTPGYGPYLFDLRSAIFRFANSKAQRSNMKSKTPAGTTVDANIPGHVLMQLLHKYVPGSGDYAQFKEGKLEVIVPELKDTSDLIGNDDGVFNLEGGLGIVQFFAPVTFRWVLYDPKKTKEDSTLGCLGRAEIMFKKYQAKDRHGGLIAGALDDDSHNAGPPPGGGDGASGSSGGRGKYHSTLIASPLSFSFL